jgi:ParB family transcriptional regulator, chromosome partitioning protein
MLGKGLESLIPPQKGDDHNGQVQPAPTSQPHQSPQSQPLQQQPQQQQQHPQQQPQQPQSNFSSQKINEIKKEEPLQMSQSVFQIELEKIIPNPDQPRRNFDQSALQDLANSIREFGFLQPLVVSKVEKETPTGVAVEYQLIAGERRYLAAKMLGLRAAPAIIRHVQLEREKLELAVIENIQRENLNPIETARAFARLQEEFRMTQREIAVKLGKSREVVANTMRLLDLPEYIREAVSKNELSESHARLLLGVSDPGTQKRLFDDILTNKLTVRDAKERVHSDGGPRRGRPPLEEVHLAPEVKALQEELSSSLGTPVEIKRGGSTGHISITFYSEEELENILRKLKQEGNGMQDL